MDRILMPLDGSELSDGILDLVTRLLERRSVLTDETAGEIELELFRVVTPDELSEGARRALDAITLARVRLEKSRTRLGALADRASLEVTVGDPAGAILDEAARTKPTLIAMTTHGRTGVERFLRGSVAERVLRGARHELLLANPFAIEEASRSGALPFQKILVPIDGSERALAVLPRVDALARRFDAEVVLVNVVPTGGSDGDGHAALGRAKALLPGRRVRTRLERGAAAPAILVAIEDEGADLLALAARGRSGPARWALGSVAENVLRHASCPLLVHRAEAAAASATPDAKHVA